MRQNKHYRRGTAIREASPIYRGMSARRFLERHMVQQEPDYFFTEGLLDLCYSLVSGQAGALAVAEEPEMPAKRVRKLLIGGAICSPLPVGVVAYTVKRYLGKRRSMALGGQGL